MITVKIIRTVVL